MNWLDFVFLGVIAISAIISLFRGFLRELVSLVVWVGGIILGLYYMPQMKGFLSGWVTSETAQYVIIIVFMIIVILLIGWLLNIILHAIVKSVGLSFVDRIVGFIFGLARGVVLVAFLGLVLTLLGAGGSKSVDGSVILPRIEPIVNWMASYLPDNLKSSIPVKELNAMGKPEKE